MEQKGKREMTGEDRRNSFRVDDALPVILCRIEDDESMPFESTAEELEKISQEDLQKELLSPLVWKMLTHLNQKLDLILEKLPVDLSKMKSQPVNLSTTGIRVVDKKKYNLQDEIRVRLLLPSVPVKELVVSGKVIRVQSRENGTYEIALQFQDLDEEIKDEIIQYTFKQQRRFIATRKNETLR